MQASNVKLGISKKFHIFQGFPYDPEGYTSYSVDGVLSNSLKIT